MGTHAARAAKMGLPSPEHVLLAASNRLSSRCSSAGAPRNSICVGLRGSAAAGFSEDASATAASRVGYQSKQSMSPVPVNGRITAGPATTTRNLSACSSAACRQSTSAASPEEPKKSTPLKSMTARSCSGRRAEIISAHSRRIAPAVLMSTSPPTRSTSAWGRLASTARATGTCNSSIRIHSALVAAGRPASDVPHRLRQGEVAVEETSDELALAGQELVDVKAAWRQSGSR